MPLLDHFHAPLHPRRHWESFHSNWATRLADALNDRWLPPEFVAEETTHAGGHLEIDVATYQETPAPGTALPNGGPPLAVAAPTYAPPAPARTVPTVFPDSFEVRVFTATGGLTLVAVIELVSPGNKDRPEERRAFAAKCGGYLHQGISLIVLDIVTSRQANLHHEIMRLMDPSAAPDFPDDVNLYGVAYRPVRRQDRAEIDLWLARCILGEPLPVLPLRLTGDLFVPVDFEAAYEEACRHRRLA
jgi:hypothetical protein